MILIYVRGLGSECQGGIFRETVITVVKRVGSGARPHGFVCRLYSLPAGWGRCLTSLCLISPSAKEETEFPS